MAMSAQQRWMLIGGALLCTLAAMHYLDEQEDTSPASTIAERGVRRGSGVLTNASVAPMNNVLPDLAKKAHIPGDKTERNADLFKAHAWYVPPAVKAAVIQVEKPVPTAPSVPYFYMGKLENSLRGTLIFLTAGNRVLTVIVGQKVDDMWRLDKEDANALYLTYLPLNMSKIQPKMARPAAASAPALAASEDFIPNN